MRPSYRELEAQMILLRQKIRLVQWEHDKLISHATGKHSMKPFMDAVRDLLAYAEEIDSV